jgi:hypothetical protein
MIKIMPMFLIIFASCGEKRLEIQGFEEYVDRFQEDAKYHGRDFKIDNLVIKFEDTSWKSEDTIGLCFSGGTTPIIHISQDYWEYARADQKIALVYHEMGHCVLGQGHRDDRMSIMNSYIVYNYLKYEGFYLAEMFYYLTPRYKQLDVEIDDQETHLNGSDITSSELNAGYYCSIKNVVNIWE